MKHRLIALLPAGLAVTGCLTLTQEVPRIESLFEAKTPEAVVEEQARPFVGLTLEETLSGSLDDLEFMSGLSVVKVVEGSAAERAGIRPRDRILEASGVALERKDQWSALLEAAAAEEQIELAVERDAAVSSVVVEVQMVKSGGLPTPTRWIDRVRARAVFRTEVAAPEPSTRVVVDQLLPGSPLTEAGIQEGSALVALDGAPLTGARQLVGRLAERSYGETVRFRVDSAGVEREVEVDLWEPPTEVTGLAVPILFNYSTDPEADKKEWAVLDLWLISLFDYRREGATRRYRFLRFFKYETGTGVLTEETDPGQ